MSARERRRRPPPPAKVKIAFGNDDDDDDDDNNKNTKQNNQEIFEDNSSVLTNQIIDKNSGDISSDAPCERAFFTIHNTTVEVILDNYTLSWSNVQGESPGDATSRQKFSTANNLDSVNFQNVYAISPIYGIQNWSFNAENIAGTSISTSNTITTSVSSSPVASPDAPLRGFQLHSYQTLQDSVLQEILIIFQSNQPNQIEQWYQMLSRVFSQYKSSRHILIMLNPYAGPRHTRHIYATKIKPMLERAKYKITYIEIEDQCTPDEAFNNFEGDFNSIDGLVIVGGDGSVTNVINALIRYLTKENRTRLDMENDLPTIPFPICIVPDGTTNIICHTIQGNTDHCTPILRLLFNQTMKIDMSAIFDADYNFVTANFSAGAGFPAQVLKYFPRYSLHSPKTVIKKSFAKAAANKNLQPIEMEIRYIQAYQDNGPGTRCYRGCPSCTPPEEEKMDDEVKTFDDFHIKKISRRKQQLSSNNDSTYRFSSVGKNLNQCNENEKNWKILHEEYLQLAVLTNANLWSFAPQGLSKSGHLANGLLDLILIEPVVRKDFLRYVKRNGNSKDPFELSFAKLIKIKEIEIELKSSIDNFFNEISNTDNQVDSSRSDSSSNEDTSDNENKQSGIQRHQPRPPSAPISEDSRRHRRRHHHISEQTRESSRNMFQSSKTMNESINYSRSRQQRQSESEMDSPQIDPYGSTTSLRQSGIFQSLKSKKDRIPLPRPSSALGKESDDEKQNKKSRRTIGGTLRPARSLLNLLASGNSSSGKNDKSSTILSRGSFSSGSKRRPSVISRSSSVDNGKISNDKKKRRKKKVPCMWNLDFTPYNSPLIRIKCFHRYLSVCGVGIDPETRFKDVNYSCF